MKQSSPEMKDTSSVPGDAAHLIFYLYFCACSVLEEEVVGGRKKSGSTNRFAETNFETSVLPVCLWLNIVLYPIPQCRLLIKNV